MSDHGIILTSFESIFGDAIDHEVIKIILQSCNWDSDTAYTQLLSLTGTDTKEDLNQEMPSKSEPLLASTIVNQNTRDVSNFGLLNQEMPSKSKPLLASTIVKQNTRDVSNFGSYSTPSTVSISDIEPPLSKVQFIKKLIFEKKKVLIIMRGLPGSGKSKLAKSLNMNGAILSTDDYFIDKFNEYNYNPVYLPEAHRWNKDRAKLKLYSGITPIFIDNTNLQLWEFEPYIQNAIKCGYYVDILEPDTYWKYNTKLLSQKCIHKVPKKKIMEMKERLENLSIEDVLKKLNLSNNLQGIDINSYRSTSRNSDSEIVVEDDSSSDSEGSDSPERKLSAFETVFNKNYCILDSQNLPKNEEKYDLSKSTAESKDMTYEQGGYCFSSDIESKMKALSCSESLNIEGNTEVSSSKFSNCKVLGDLSDWKPVPASRSSWSDSPSSVKSKQNTTSLFSSKPQRFKKVTNEHSNDNTYFQVSEENENGEDEYENINWSPVKDLSQLSWENNPDSSICKHSLQPQVKPKVNRYSQFNEADFSTSSTFKTIEGSPSNFKPHSKNIKAHAVNNKEILHKNIMTDDCSLIEKENVSCPLKKLKSFFPDIEEEDLEDVLEKCDFDIDWTMNLLIDSGYKISSDISKENFGSLNLETSEEVITSSFSVTQAENDLDIGNNEDGSTSSVEKEESTENDSTSHNTSNLSLFTDEEDDNEKEGAQYLTMEIDNQFASQLINLYGPISSLSMTGFTKEDLRIVIPLEICHDIYKYWAETLEGKFKHETDILDKFIREDEELARKLQEEENAASCTQVESEVEKEPTSFQKIVEMQTREEKQLNSKVSKENITCSSMLSLQKLQEEFNHVDATAIEEEYFNQNLDFANTKTLLNYKYGAGKSIQNIEQEHNDTEEEWEDFSISVQDPQMYRDEAQLHYLERRKALLKAQEASGKGMKSTASYYAQIGNLHFKKFKEANERASQKILNAINSKRGPNSLDLHLLHVDEALREVQRFLAERRNVLVNMNLKVMMVSIITGKGKHSAKGEPRLKPAIKTFLKKEGYHFQEYDGMFKVTLSDRGNS